MIEFILDFISMLIAFGFMFWIFLFILKMYYKKNNKRKILGLTENIEKKFKCVVIYICNVFFVLLRMTMAIILAIGAKPIIYKLNTTLGWNYATFASYVIAICLYLLLPDYTIRKDNKSGHFPPSKK